MPPSPATWRARVGAKLIAVVQRMLFWYTPQIRQFHCETAAILGKTSELLEQQSRQIADLQREIRTLRAGTPVIAATPGDGAGLPASFEFALQDHFRGTECETSAKLAVWFDAIGKADGPWLDVGCGRGEWLAMAARRKQPVKGIDPSGIAIGYCREQGLDVEQTGALEYLEKLEDGSLAVVTAFQVAEHFPIHYLLAFVQMAARKLRPGGMLAVETPDPANILMGSHLFWNDPTHQRPVPLPLMEFIFGHYGLKVVRSLHLNPFPAAQHLPYTEIGLIKSVDELLYGARDYGLIGRRDG